MVSIHARKWLALMLLTSTMRPTKVLCQDSQPSREKYLVARSFYHKREQVMFEQSSVFTKDAMKKGYGPFYGQAP
jgi:hypothetical protein